MTHLTPLAIALTASLAAAPLGAAQDAVAPNASAAAVRRPIPTVTRLVQLLGGLERDCLEAIRTRDAAALDALLADDFETRVASRPDQPIPRADWIEQALKAPAPLGTVSRLAARDLGGVVLVSFRLQSEPQPPGSGPALIVDAWVPAGASFRLAARFVGADDSLPVPGDGASQDRLPKRP